MEHAVPSEKFPTGKRDNLFILFHSFWKFSSETNQKILFQLQPNRNFRSLLVTGKRPLFPRDGYSMRANGKRFKAWGRTLDHSVDAAVTFNGVKVFTTTFTDQYKHILSCLLTCEGRSRLDCSWGVSNLDCLLPYVAQNDIIKRVLKR